MYWTTRVSTASSGTIPLQFRDTCHFEDFFSNIRYFIASNFLFLTFSVTIFAYENCLYCKLLVCAFMAFFESITVTGMRLFKGFRSIEWQKYIFNYVIFAEFRLRLLYHNRNCGHCSINRTPLNCAMKQILISCETPFLRQRRTKWAEGVMSPSTTFLGPLVVDQGPIVGDECASSFF